MSEFVCTICDQSPDVRWEPRSGPLRHRRPVCRYCEGEWGRPAKDGAFADRRAVAVGSALAEALASTAGFRLWETSL